MLALETHKTAISQFMEIADRQPQAIAIDSGEDQVTYGAMKARAAAIAAHIDDVASPVSRDDVDIVAILAQHDAAAITAVAGVILSGRVYAPLDARHSVDRLRRMMQVARAPTILVADDLLDVARQIAGPRVNIITLSDALASGGSLDRTESLTPEDPAYLLFTSGMTGEPKGLLHTHRSLARSAALYAEDSELTTDDRVSLVLPISYAPSTFSVFGALTSGAALCLRNVPALGVKGLDEWVVESGVTLLQTVPTMFRRWAGTRGKQAPAGRLRMVQLAGEPLLASDVELFKRAFPTSVRLYNGMGTSETSCVARAFFDHSMSFPHGRAPMGVAYDDIGVFIRNSEGRPLGYGEIGSLFVRGRDFAHGYFARPDLSTARFQQDPEDPDYWIYDTGDLATRLPDGRLVHCGRAGQHVTIGRIRVDPSEIESTLMGLDPINEAVVESYRDAEDHIRLAAYVTAAPGFEPTPEGLRWRLSALLPTVMIPTTIVVLAELPTLRVGKVNREALPAVTPVEAAAPTAPPPSSQPRDDIDALVLSSFRQALSNPDVEFEQDFFDLGGDSLKALDLTMRLQESLGVAMSASTLLKAPTPQNLAREVRRDITAPQTDNVIVFSSGEGAEAEDTPALYCVPGIGGHSLQYRALTDKLGPRQRCYGLEFQGVDGRMPPLDSIEAIAKYFEAHIRRTSPSGPIALVGYCIGGLVAFELARRLKEGDREVAFVALLHSLPPSDMRHSLRRTAREHLARQLRDEGVVESVKSIGRALGASAMRRLRPNIGLPPGVELPVRIQKVQDALTAAAQAYRPEPHPIDMVFFRADKSAEPDRDPASAWRTLCDSRLTVVEAPGDHLDMFKPPAIDIVADRMLLRLGGEKARAKLGKLGSEEDPLGPLNELWGLNNADGLACRILTSEELPDHVRKLVDHENRMTRTLELLHEETIRLQVLGQQQIGRHFMRKIALDTIEGGVTTALAVIRINMDVFDPASQRRILIGDEPFGTILDTAGIPGENEPVAFFEVEPDAHMLADMQADPSYDGSLFGRRNFIRMPDGRLIADVVEVLAPVSVIPR